MSSKQETFDGPETEPDPETFEAVTVFEATNADTIAIRAGHFAEPKVMEEPELHDKTPMYARRRFVPVSVVVLPEAMAMDAVFEWVEQNKDHAGLEAVDWEQESRKEWIDTIVRNRAQYNRFLRSIEQRLEDTLVVGTQAKQEIDAIQADIVDTFTNSPGCVAHLVEPEGDDE